MTKMMQDFTGSNDILRYTSLMWLIVGVELLVVELSVLRLPWPRPLVWPIHLNQKLVVVGLKV